MARLNESVYKVGIKLDGCMEDATAKSAYKIIGQALANASQELYDIGITSVTMDLRKKRRVM